MFAVVPSLNTIIACILPCVSVILPLLRYCFGSRQRERISCQFSHVARPLSSRWILHSAAIWFSHNVFLYSDWRTWNWEICIVVQLKYNLIVHGISRDNTRCEIDRELHRITEKQKIHIQNILDVSHSYIEKTILLKYLKI